MTIETLKSPNPRDRNSISVIKSKFLSVSSMNSLLAILKFTDARRDSVVRGAGLGSRGASCKRHEMSSIKNVWGGVG